MTEDKKKCDGIRTSWPWQWYPCGAVGKYELDGNRYCGTHYAKAVKAKEQHDAESVSPKK